MTLEDYIASLIRQREFVVILRSDIAPLGSTARVGRVLAKLVADGALVRVRKVCTPKRESIDLQARNCSGGDLPTLGHHGSVWCLAREYNAGTTTQVPVDGVVSTGTCRIRRKIQCGGSYKPGFRAASTETFISMRVLITPSAVAQRTSRQPGMMVYY